MNLKVIIKDTKRQVKKTLLKKNTITLPRAPKENSPDEIPDKECETMITKNLNEIQENAERKPNKLRKECMIEMRNSTKD
jgi:hypothetical protein